jgi:putative MATE family efflux protein
VIVRGPLRRHDREILRLAVPAFLALVAEPLFLLADSAIVGHLGTPQLAALGVASAVLGTLVSLCIFLAYGTTASVARQMGAGRDADALAEGVSGLWLAALIGVAVTVLTWPLTARLSGLFGTSAQVADLAVTYLHLALLGAVPMLLMLAATGVLRGLQDTRTPLVVAVLANLANIGLNLLLVYGLGAIPGMGIAGSALGTLLAQVGSALALVWVVVRAARRARSPLRPHPVGVARAARAGVPLIVRTLLLRGSLLVMTYAAARHGDDELAAMQLALTIWTFLAFVLDAVAIAAQAITGRYLGAADTVGTRAVTHRIERWGWATGVVTGLLLAAASPVLGGVFTGDGHVRSLLVPVLLVAAVAQPVAGIVFVLDGVLIGAGDAVYLAWAQLASLALFAPAAYLLQTSLLDAGGARPPLVWLWIAFAGLFMGVRAVTLVTRAHGERWMRLGV